MTEDVRSAATRLLNALDTYGLLEPRGAEVVSAAHALRAVLGDSLQQPPVSTHSISGGSPTRTPAASFTRLLDRLDGDYNFTCEGGPLRNCVEWQQLRRLVADLSQQIAQQETEIARLQDTVKGLCQAKVDGARMDAITDERCVGFYRDLSLRLSEERDRFKHRIRALEATLAQQAREQHEKEKADARVVDSQYRQPLATAPAVAPDAHGLVRSLLARLPFPDRLPAPTILIEGDGDLGIDWDERRDASVSVSLSPAGMVCWAALIGDWKATGWFSLPSWADDFNEAMTRLGVAMDSPAEDA